LQVTRKNLPSFYASTWRNCSLTSPENGQSPA
jgi:hypothetical protein